MKTALKEPLDSFSKGLNKELEPSEITVYSLPSTASSGHNVIIVTEPEQACDSLILRKAIDMQTQDPDLTYRYASDLWSDHAPEVLRQIQLNRLG